MDDKAISAAFEGRSGYAPDNVQLLVQQWVDSSGPPVGSVRNLEKWRSPASAYPRATVGNARIRTAWYTPGVYDAYGQQDIRYYHALKRLYITTLEIEGSVWMVDDPPHWWAMEHHASFYEGHVLCAGLGLGLMVHALTANPKVEQITVVEREQDVIALVAPLVPHEKLSIVRGDFWDQNPDTIPDVDGVLWDLFVGSGPLLIEAAVQVLSQIYKTWYNGPGFVGRIHGVPNALILAQMLSANVGTTTKEGR